MKFVDVADDPRAAWLAIEGRNWGDGLPCIPPTSELVEAMLGERDAAEQVALLAPSDEWATVGLVAINAVMAGCEPAVLPVVLAAVRAAGDPAFNLLAVQSTTNPATEVLIVNGPVVRELGVESGAGCMGAGGRTNLTIGRAVRLVMANVGGARPGEGDSATQGFPGKLAFCFAEAEEASPWPPLHEALGRPAGTSAVTVVSGSGSLNLLDTSDDGEELLLAFSRAIAYPSSNDYLWGGMPLVVMGPEHADVIDRGGFDRAEAQRFLFERSTIPASHITRSNRRSFLEPGRGELYGGIEDDTPIHVADRPEDILIAVAGGPGTHTVYVPTFGDSRAVTEDIRA